jgi:hypothetical protein
MSVVGMHVVARFSHKGCVLLFLSMRNASDDFFSSSPKMGGAKREEQWMMGKRARKKKKFGVLGDLLCFAFLFRGLVQNFKVACSASFPSLKKMGIGGFFR